MDRNKKEYPTKDLSSHNNTFLTADLNNGAVNKEISNEQVNFYSDFINEAVENLDITV